MELNTIKDAFDRVAKKQKLSSSKSQEVIEQISQEINKAISRIQTELNYQNSILDELKTKLKELAPLSQLEPTQKELNIALTKYPKLLEKYFIPDISKSYRNVDTDIRTINQIIAAHFYREGLFDLGDSFVHETLEIDDVAVEMKSPFLELYNILESMKGRDLGPALTWAGQNRVKLVENGSDLELKLHRLQFMEILQTNGRDDALKYARTFLAPFAGGHMAEIQKLMASLLWAGRLDVSPYSDFLSPTRFEELTEELTRQFCNLIGQSHESPLAVTVAAGVQGLPTLLKLMSVMAAGRQHEWQNLRQLPVPVDLGPEFQFHSIFVCPVSRDPATEENPAMLLTCGHVLCKQSIAKLSKNHSTRPFKCPYCPCEVEVSQCKQLYF